MTPTMRERVARAIASVQPQAGQSAEDWMLARAGAAIAALRDPTAEMEAAFYAACDERGHVLWKHGYRAMIDAALAEKA